MRIIEPITADEMVAVFLRTEITAFRYDEQILEGLARRGLSRALIDTPNVRNPEENALRADLLGKVRGYGRNADVFTGVTADVTWCRAVLNPADLMRVTYIDYEYWTDISGGTRLAIDGARRILEGAFPTSEAAAYWNLADALVQGTVAPEIIVLHNPVRNDLVLLEGHKRLTALLLRPHLLPELRVILGVSGHLPPK